jgi:hypothetical protein
MSTDIKQAINEFLLSCKVEGKSYGTIECYSDKLRSGATTSGFGGQGIDKPLERGYTLVPSWNPSGNKTEVREVNIAKSSTKEARHESNNDVQDENTTW